MSFTCQGRGVLCSSIMLRNQAQQRRSIMLVRNEQAPKALRVHSAPYEVVPSALMLGDNVTRAFECVESGPDKALTDRGKINFRCSRKGLVPRMSGVSRHWKRLPNTAMGSLPWKYLKIG